MTLFQVQARETVEDEKWEAITPWIKDHKEAVTCFAVMFKSWMEHNHDEQKEAFNSENCAAAFTHMCRIMCDNGSKIFDLEVTLTRVEKEDLVGVDIISPTVH